MSGDFSTVLIKDSAIAGITDKLVYAVQSGAASNTYQSFRAISSSPTSITFNINVPSENVIVNREVYVRTKINFTVVQTGVAVGSRPEAWATDLATQAFPFNHLITTATAQINNTNVSVNLQDVLPQLLQMCDQEELSRYSGMCPNLIDGTVAKFSAGSGHAINALKGLNASDLDKPFQPRGAFTIKLVDYSRFSTLGTSPNVWARTLGVSLATADIYRMAYQIEVCEPLIGLSPFIYGNPKYNNQGLVGINAMNFVFNIDSTLKRFLCATIASPNLTVETGIKTNNTTNNIDTTALFEDTTMLLNFMSPQSKDVILARNVVPYVDLPRYIASNATASVTGTAAGVSTTLNSQNLQLNQIPDLFLICVRKRMTDQNLTDCEYTFPITQISINFNNTSGLLSSATNYDLWRMSVANGSKQTWSQFQGVANFTGAATDTNTGVTPTATTGGLLVISPPMDMSLPDYLTSGSIGSYNFQFTITFSSYLAEAVTPEIVVVAVNSGIFTTVAGSSNIYTGILTKQMVMDAKDMGSVNPVMSAEFKRMVGGNIVDKALASIKEHPSVKEFVKKAMKRLHGEGVSSGGGVQSGGRLSHLYS